MILKRLLPPVAWPALLSASLFLTWLGFQAGFDPEMVVLVVYLMLALAILGLEWLMPHERSWQTSDGQTGNDLLHTVFGSAVPEFLAKGLVILLFSNLAMHMATGSPGSLWPRDWFFPVQVALAVFVADFGLYWAHRLGHEWMLFWRFHALHHSPPRLWFINTGRFHFVDSFKSTVFGMPLLILLNPPTEIIFWYVACLNYVGILSHCNIELRPGILNYIFNTPGVHRWHHSRKLAESNHNYGEILMLWDLIFGTHFLPKHRPPADLGIDYVVPSGFLAQLAFPFTMRELASGRGATDVD